MPIANVDFSEDEIDQQWKLTYDAIYNEVCIQFEDQLSTILDNQRYE